VTIDELKAKNINAETLIWSEDLVTWTKAKDVAELKDWFPTPSSIPPPVGRPAQSAAGSFNPNTQRPPKTYLVEAIITTILCCWPLGIPSIVYASRVERKFYEGDIQGSEEASANAKKWMLINLGACILLWIAYFAIFGVALFGTLWNDI
jgi:hypothetical protein